MVSDEYVEGIKKTMFYKYNTDTENFVDYYALYEPMSKKQVNKYHHMHRKKNVKNIFKREFMVVENHFRSKKETLSYASIFR